jgi:predicted nuclease with TOPRIM domain
MREVRDEQRKLQEALQAAREREYELRKREETLQQQLQSSDNHDIHKCRAHRRCKWAAKLDKKLRNEMSVVTK